jgi:hypothetical protein
VEQYGAPGGLPGAELKHLTPIPAYVENEREIFLKTAFPSRKYQKKYGVDEGK